MRAIKFIGENRKTIIKSIGKTRYNLLVDNYQNRRFDRRLEVAWFVPSFIDPATGYGPFDLLCSSSYLMKFFDMKVPDEPTNWVELTWKEIRVYY